VEEGFFAPVQTGHEVHPASCTTGTGSLSRGAKRPGRGHNSPPEVKQYSYRCTPRATMACSGVNLALFFIVEEGRITKWGRNSTARNSPSDLTDGTSMILNKMFIQGPTAAPREIPGFCEFLGPSSDAAGFSVTL